MNRTLCPRARSSGLPLMPVRLALEPGAVRCESGVALLRLFQERGQALDPLRRPRVRAVPLPLPVPALPAQALVLRQKGLAQLGCDLKVGCALLKFEGDARELCRAGGSAGTMLCPCVGRCVRGMAGAALVELLEEGRGRVEHGKQERKRGKQACIFCSTFCKRDNASSCGGGTA
jgi:hypothetical protein